MKKIFLSLGLVLLSSLSLFGITSAAFEEKVSAAGTSFTIGESTGGTGGGGGTANTALKILLNNSSSPEGSNLGDTVPGPTFSDFKTESVEAFPVKLYNKGNKILSVVGGATYVNDPDTLRDDLFIEILDWNDANNNGTAEENEIGQSHGHDTILRFKNDTFNLGDLNASSVKGYVLKFDGSGLSEANVGKTAVYDFLFTAVEKASQ